MSQILAIIALILAIGSNYVAGQRPIMVLSFAVMLLAIIFLLAGFPVVTHR